MLKYDLWRFKRWCSDFSLHACVSLHNCLLGKSKVNDFKVVILVKEDVLRFQISMRIFLVMDELQSRAHLLEVEAANFFGKWLGLDVVEKLSSRNIFKGHVGNFNFTSIFFMVDS